MGRRAGRRHPAGPGRSRRAGRVAPRGRPSRPAGGIKLTVRGEVEGLDDAQFAKAAQDAKFGCPVSKALTGADISLDAQLEH